ncbi:MAG TPA: 2-oxoacid:acceptor oxidoreductase subunit alpha [Planctomycetota bacterium]|nr:2-oxoacid:acceptor oxidoreductase subunit alpha [Planctomycetota bacterium]
MTTEATAPKTGRKREVLESVTIRFAGDSGDGVQQVGGQFTTTSAVFGNDLSTFPDFPAEIRAPAGTLPGVSGFQIQFAAKDIHTPGDQPDVLVAFNPAALLVNIKDMAPNSVVIVNTDSFDEVDLKKAQCTTNPLEDGSLSAFNTFKIPITELTLKALEPVQMTHKDKERCKNYFALGVLYWLYNRPLETTLHHIQDKFGKDKYGKPTPQLVESNSLALKAGWGYAEATELFRSQYEVPPATYAPGKYRNVMGNEALALGLVAAGKLSGLPIFYGSYPITPASDILHDLSKYKNFGVITFQAEDEIAAVTAAIGASYAGALGVTGTSGPGVALKSEAINLAVMVELPLIICDVQRGGPSTGLPTKTEQADLLQALYGRNSESPVCVLAPATPGDCFDIAIQAARIATKYMVPVFILSDGYLANGAEPWKLPKLSDLPKFPVKFQTAPDHFAPYLRDEITLARPWALPGTPGLEHRIGGIEKSHIYGNVSYDPDNHDFMCRIRAAKIQRIVQDVPDAQVHGDPDAKILMLGWGSPYGSITAAVEEARRRGIKVAQVHLRHLNPFPANLGAILKKYPRILVPELNLGQLLMVIRAKFLVDARGLNKVQGKPFKVAELVEAIEQEAKSLQGNGSAK